MQEILHSIRTSFSSAKELNVKARELVKKEKKLEKEAQELYKETLILEKLREHLDKRDVSAKQYMQAIDAHKHLTKALQISDKLLEKLPQEEIEQFVKSKDFQTYKKAMQEHLH